MCHVNEMITQVSSSLLTTIVKFNLAYNAKCIVICQRYNISPWYLQCGNKCTKVWCGVVYDEVQKLN